MASYTRGLEINKKEIQKYTENIAAQTVRRAKKVGEIVNEELRRESVIDWFNGNGFSRNESWYTMLHSLDYVPTQIHAKKGGVDLYFTSYINPEKYEIEHTSLYRQRNKYTGINDPFEYIVGTLQWEQGIIGLPQKSSASDWVNKYFYQASKNLRDFTMDKYKNTWIKRLNRYWKTMGVPWLDKLS